MNASRGSKRDTLQKKPESTTKSPNRRASQGRRNASPHSPPPYNLRSGRKLTARGKSNSKGKSSKSQNKSRSSSRDKHGSSHKKHSITTAEVEETLKDEINHKFGTTSPGGSSPSNSKNKGHKQTENKSKGKTPNKKTTTPNKPSKSTPRNQSRSSTPSGKQGSGKKASLDAKRKSSVSKGPSHSTRKSDVIEEEKVDKKNTGKRSVSKTPGKIEEESNKKGKESVGKRSPGRMVDESKKQTPSKTPSRQAKTPSKSKGSKGKSVGKGLASKSPGRMSEESGRKGARNITPSKATPKRTPSRSNTKKRKAEEISKNPDLGAQGDLQALGGTAIQNELKKVKDNKQDGLGKEHLEKIKIVDLAKKKPSTSTKRQTRASSGKADKGSAEKNKSAEKDRSSSSGKKSKKKVVNGKKKTDNEEEASENTVEMKLLEMRVVVKGKGYCVWRKITLIDDIPMTKVARIIVTAMGWLGCWDWKFKLDDKEVLLPPDDDEDREETTRQKFYGDEVTLSKFKVKEGDKFQFIYNPQSKNPWVHDIVVESLDRVQVDKDDNSEKAKMFQHAVVANGSLSVPPDRITPVDFEKICEDFNKGEREFDKWKSQLGDDFNMNTFNKNKINEILKIHVYDEEKMDPKVREGNIFFKW